MLRQPRCLKIEVELAKEIETIMNEATYTNDLPQRESLRVFHVVVEAPEDESFPSNTSLDINDEIELCHFKSPWKEQQGTRMSLDTHVSTSMDSITFEDLKVEVTTRGTTRQSSFARNEVVDISSTGDFGSDESAMFVKASAMKMSSSSTESEVDLRIISSHNSDLFWRGKDWMSSRKRLASFDASMPRLIAIAENNKSTYNFQESISSFVGSASNEFNKSFIDSSTRTISSHETGATNYASMPSLLSIYDNEDSELLIFDISNSYVASVTSDSTSFDRNSITDTKGRSCRIHVTSHCRNPPMQGFTKETLSPSCATNYLQGNILEKRVLRWDTSVVSVTAPNHSLEGTSSLTSRISGPLSFKRNGLASLSLDDDSFDGSISLLDLVVPEQKHAGQRVMALDDSMPLFQHHGDTCPTVAVRFASLTSVMSSASSGSFTSLGVVDDVRSSTESRTSKNDNK